MPKRNNIDDLFEDNTTKYGEFISSFHKWILPKKQKERASKLQEKVGK